MKRGEDHVPRESRLHGYLGSIRVTNFSDHHYVRVLAERRAESFRESVTLLQIYLRLSYAGQMVFNRVFDGDDIYFGGINFSQESVESRRLSRTSRSSNQNHAVWFSDFILNNF